MSYIGYHSAGLIGPLVDKANSGATVQQLRILAKTHLARHVESGMSLVTCSSRYCSLQHDF